MQESLWRGILPGRFGPIPVFIPYFCRWKISPMFSVHSSNIYCLCSKSNACICLASSVERLREENILKSGCFRCFSPAPFKTNCQLITSSSFSTLESETNSCFSDFPQRRKWALRTSGTPAPASTDRAPAAGKILLLIWPRSSRFDRGMRRETPGVIFTEAILVSPRSNYFVIISDRNDA